MLYLAALILVGRAYARFGQEQGNGAIEAIAALTNFGQSGQAATLAGSSIQFLLGGANPCDKLKQADQIVSQLGTDDAVIAAARGLVAAEQNFNPFTASVPSICSDPTLPQTAQLRGVVPLVDPAVVGSDVENSNAETSKTSPFDADGLSVAQVMAANGFSNFTAVAADGTAPANGNSGNGNNSGSGNGNGNGNNNDNDNNGNLQTSVQSEPTAPTQCPQVSTVYVTMTQSQVPAASSGARGGSCTGTGNTLACSSPANGDGAVQDAVAGNFAGFQASTIQGLDFGLCVPTMKFEPALNGRPDTEFTFQATDPLVNKGQQEALNPAIIANRIKDQMTNVCGANSAAKDAVAAAMAQVVSSGAKNAGVAEDWNAVLGFAGADINPDNAPKAGLVGHA